MAACKAGAVPVFITDMINITMTAEFSKNSQCNCYRYVKIVYRDIFLQRLMLFHLLLKCS